MQNVLASCDASCTPPDQLKGAAVNCDLRNSSSSAFVRVSGSTSSADGMVDDILMALSRVRWLFVIARQSSFIYEVRAADVQQIGRELGVRYVVAARSTSAVSAFLPFTKT